MSSKVPLPQSSPSSDPALLKVTEAITGTFDAKAASGIADMLLIFLSAAGTILGAIVGASPIFFGPRTPWRTWGTRPIPFEDAMT
jgi:hypothetical protein